jgi:hypothetical protein
VAVGRLGLLVPPDRVAADEPRENKGEQYEEGDLFANNVQDPHTAGIAHAVILATGRRVFNNGC